MNDVIRLQNITLEIHIATQNSTTVLYIHNFCSETFKGSLNYSINLCVKMIPDIIKKLEIILARDTFRTQSSICNECFCKIS